MEFRTVSDYLRALGHDPALAIVPLTLAAAANGVTRAAIDRMLGLGQLDEIRIGGTRFVRAHSLINRDRAWADQVTVVRSELKRIAAAGAATCYQPLMDKIGLSHSRPSDRRAIGKILGTIGRETLREHRIVLSVLVHHKGTDRPGKGFLREFRDVLEPGHSDGDLIDREMRRVWDFYRPKKAAA
jgi:hypothetical protein